jgi:aquaporin Z
VAIRGRTIGRTGPSILAGARLKPQNPSQLPMAVAAYQRYFAEFLGTFGLLLFGVGTAEMTLNAAFAVEGRFLAISFAFGIVVLAGAFAFGEVSGAHFNPAVTLSMAVSRKMPGRDVIPYLVAQLLGALLGVEVVLAIAQGTSGNLLSLVQANALTSQGFSGNGAPSGFATSLGAVFLLEMVLTFFFVLVIHRVTRDGNPAKPFAPIAIGFTLFLTQLVAIPIDNASINPYRSLAPALIAQVWPSAHWAIVEVWVFIVAPIVGGLLAAGVDMILSSPSKM